MEETKAPFDYETVNKRKVHLTLSKGNYSAYSDKDTSFIVLTKDSEGEEEDIGWKIHIAVHPKDVEKAWNISSIIFTKYGIEIAKALKKGAEFTEDQYGKELTVYAQNSSVDWKKMLQEITTLFVKNNIRPYYKPIGDKQLQGSSFFSCRCDKNSEGKSVTALEVESHNISGKPYFFEELAVDETELSDSIIVKPTRTEDQEKNIRQYYKTREEYTTKFGQLLTDIFSQVNSRFYSIESGAFLNRANSLYNISENDEISLEKMIKEIIEFNKQNPHIGEINNLEFEKTFLHMSDFYEKNLMLLSKMSEIITPKESAEENSSEEGSCILNSEDENSVVEKELEEETEFNREKIIDSLVFNFDCHEKDLQHLENHQLNNLNELVELSTDSKVAAVLVEAIHEKTSNVTLEHIKDFNTEAILSVEDKFTSPTLSDATEIIKLIMKFSQKEEKEENISSKNELAKPLDKQFNI